MGYDVCFSFVYFLNFAAPTLYNSTSTYAVEYFVNLAISLVRWLGAFDSSHFPIWGGEWCRFFLLWRSVCVVLVKNAFVSILQNKNFGCVCVCVCV